MSDQWISVDEQMPDCDIEVLMGWVDRDGCDVGFFDGESWMTPFDEFVLRPPTHWMDLPPGPGAE